MAFDMGWNPRSSAGFVTDPSYAVPMLVEDYPHTYTNVDGYSINAGVTVANQTKINRNAANDPRLAGIAYVNGATGTFRVDLSSGSNPGAGTYLVDLAAGDDSAARVFDEVTVKDNVTTLITFAGTTGGGGHYFDATGTNINAGTAAWAGTAVSSAFASTTAFFIIANAAGVASWAHFRLTLAGGAAPEEELVPQLTLLGVGR